MTEFWEDNFNTKQKMWGDHPTPSAYLAKTIFIEEGKQNILVPGFGYGRNAKVFMENGLHVTGIEISKTAIDLAKQHLGKELTIHHGTVDKMPFDNTQFDGIYCHALLHLLDSKGRIAFLNNCFLQLKNDGLLIFTVVSVNAKSYGKGKQIGEHRFEQHQGVHIYFYDQASIEREFQQFNILEIKEIQEDLKMFYVICRKKFTYIFRILIHSMIK